MATQKSSGKANRKTTNSQNRRPTANRRIKRKRSNNYLYAAIVLLIIALSLICAIICISVGCDGGENESSFAESSGTSSEISNESSETTSDPEESSNESSEPIAESSEPESSAPPVEPDHGSSERTQAYEDYIGVDYAIDMKDYEIWVCPENEEDFVFLVNPDNPLGSDYVPKDLILCTNIREGRPSYYSYIDKTANYALEAFLKEAAYYGFDDITVTNAYRSYSTQDSIFKSYVATAVEDDAYCDTCKKYYDHQYEKSTIRTGKCSKCGSELRNVTKDEATAFVLTYSTRPGTSEHQSGLCCDMHNLPSTTSAFDNTAEAKWLAANAHRFGFILRYPPDTQDITGIKHESWHFRYVGRTAATEIYEAQEKLGLDRMYTLDEYVAAMEGDKPATPDMSDALSESELTYALDKGKKVFHVVDCSETIDIDNDDYYEKTCTRQSLINEGYSPCGSCEP